MTVADDLAVAKALRELGREIVKLQQVNSGLSQLVQDCMKRIDALESETYAGGLRREPMPSDGLTDGGNQPTPRNQQELPL